MPRYAEFEEPLQLASEGLRVGVAIAGVITPHA
jgi:hypothetical protein